jgi:ABC-type lipoprotein release transport system permease subunit
MPLSTLRIAWRNLGRNKRRTLLAAGAIALGQTTLVFVNGLMAGSFNDMLEAVTGPLGGHVQIHHPDWRDERAVDQVVDNLSRVRSELQRLPEVRRVSARRYAAALAASGEKSDAPAVAEPAMVLGVDVEAESAPGGLLESVPPDRHPGNGAVAVGIVLANKLGLEPGKQIAIIGQDVDGFPASDLFDVAAVIGSSVGVVKTLGIVMSAADAGTLLAMPDQAHELIVQGEDYRRAGELAAEAAALPALAGTEVLSWRQASPELVRIIEMKGWWDFIFLAIVFVAAAAGIANTSMMSAFERTHEFGMLLAVGASPGRIIRMVLIESVVIGLIGVAVGSAVGCALVLITSRTGINYAALAGSGAEDVVYGGISISYIIHPVFEVRHVLFGLGAVTVTSVLASLWPATLAARLEAVEAMRS